MTTPPSLDDRFLEPPGWRWHRFKNSQGRFLRFGSIYPESRIPTAVIVLLPGRTEFAEKYFETARDLTARNLAVWTMDWQGQGKSDRLPGPYPKRNHSPDFSQHVEDLHQFIMGYVKHACVHPDVGRIPMVMLAQSMGANIGLRYLHKYPGMFECAALSTPLLGVKALENIPFLLGLTISQIFGTLVPRGYAFGQKDWSPHERDLKPEIFSSDPVRIKIHNAWCESDPALQVGGVTFGWLRRALASSAVIRRKDTAASIKTPCLVALAGKEELIDNAAIRTLAGTLPKARLLELAEAGHEILMERDDLRNRFFEAFHQLIKESIIDRPETLKPF